LYHILGYTFLAAALILMAALFFSKSKENKKLLIKNSLLEEEIRNFTKKLDEDLRLAHDFKRQYLTNNHSLHGVDVSVRHFSDSVVGGEFFSLIPLDKNPDRCRRCIEPCGSSICHLAKNEGSFIIGDMNISGLPAALMIAQVLSTAEQVAGSITSPGKVLERVNNFIYKSKSQQHNFYTTAFYGYIDQRKGVLKYSHGGHEPPIYYSRSANKARRLEAPGLVLGTNLNQRFEEKEVYLSQGDKIIMYTPLLEEKETVNLLGLVTKNIQENMNSLLDNVEKELKNLAQSKGHKRNFILVGLEIVNTPFGQYKVPAHLFMISKVTEEVIFIAQQLGMRNKGIIALRISLNEILSNAIIHGSGKDPNKSIEIVVWIEDKSLKVKVKDSGKGFDYKKLDFEKIPEDLLAEEGRGLFLVKHYVDEMHFDDGGSSITITKVID